MDHNYFDEKLPHSPAYTTKVLKTLVVKKQNLKVKEYKLSWTGVDFNFTHDDTENKTRGNWSDHWDFILSCLGYAVGLGNVWRFPYLCYSNGGAVFLIPYTIMLFFVGIPLFVLETGIGQFTSLGPLTCWHMAPAFQGIGVGMLIVSGIVGLYYNIIMAWAFYYFFASFTDHLPWENCDRKWATDFCQDFLQVDVTLADCTMRGLYPAEDGVCYDLTGPKLNLYGKPQNHTPVGIYNQEVATEFGIKPILPAEEYLNAEVLGVSYSNGFGDFGVIQWKLLGCLAVAWTVCTFCVIGGIKTSGKVVYFTAIFPYFMLVVLLIRGLLLEGYDKGIYFYIADVKLDILLRARVWKDAASQIFFSLSAAMGGLIALSSYNRFHNDFFKDAFTIAICNCLTSVFAGFAIFSFIGFFAESRGVKVEDVVESGLTLAFVIFPSAVTLLPASPLWSCVFFLMLITLGLDSQFVFIETVTTGILDQFPSTRPKKKLLIICTCITFFLLDITMVTRGGLYIFALLDHYGASWGLLLNGLMEVVCVGWVYGVYRFSDDIYLMLGNKKSGDLYEQTVFVWLLMWCLITPAIISFVIYFSLYDYHEARVGDYEFPISGVLLGWGITSLVVISNLVTPFAVTAHYYLNRNEDWKAALNPTQEWGPYLPKYRRLMKYYRNRETFDINPWNVEGQDADVNEHKRALASMSAVPQGARILPGVTVQMDDLMGIMSESEVIRMQTDGDMSDMVKYKAAPAIDVEFDVPTDLVKPKPSTGYKKARYPKTR